MEKITIKEKVFNVADKWEDLTVSQYVSIADLYSKSSELIEEDFLVKFILIISDMDKDFVESLYEEELAPFIELIKNFNMNDFKSEKATHFIINEKLYSYTEASKLTLGEKISLKLLEKKSLSESETWLNILSITIRPATKKLNEFDEEVFDVEPFSGDIEVLEKRKELIKNIKATNAFYILQGFLDGRK